MPQRFAFRVSVLLLALISSIHCQQVPDQVIEIFRHGAKAVYSQFDPSWPANENGDLTPVGMRQHYILGKALAEKYPSIFGSNYNYSLISVLSDTTPRCIQSAQAQLYGMYLGSGPALNSTYSRDLAVPPFQDPVILEIADSLPNSAALPFNYVPTIVDIVDSSDEYLFEISPTSCPNEFIWYEENLKSAQFQERMQLFQPTLDNLNAYFNETLSLEDLSDIMNDIESDVAANKSMPGGIDNPQLISNLTYAFAYVSVASFLGQEGQRQIGGFGLINAVIQELTSFRQGESFNYGALYSGHDLNLWAILAAFGVVSEDCVLANFQSSLTNSTIPYPNCYYPPFASNIIIELYNSTEAPFVKVFYNNVPLSLCNGQTSCSYEDFIFFANNATGNSTVQEYFQKCGANVTMPSDSDVMLAFHMKEPFSPIQTYVNIQLVIIIGLVILCSILVMKNASDKRKLNQLLNERLLYDEDNRIKLY